MTFNGASYESILDLEKLVVIEQAKLKALKLKLSTLQKLRDKDGIEDTLVAIGIQKNYVNELEKVERILLYKVDLFNRSANDIESKVFISKFVKNKTDDGIKHVYKLTDEEYSKICNDIYEKLKSTEYGEHILKTLQK